MFNRTGAGQGTPAVKSPCCQRAQLLATLALAPPHPAVMEHPRCRVNCIPPLHSIINVYSDTGAANGIKARQGSYAGAHAETRLPPKQSTESYCQRNSKWGMEVLEWEKIMGNQ